MTKKQKAMLWRIIAGVVLFIAAIFVKAEGAFKLLIFIVPYLVLGFDVIKSAAANLLRGKMLDENFLMTVATIGAFCIGEYPEAVFVMLFYKVGEFFEKYAVGKSRNSIAELMDIRPDYANIEQNGELVQVMPESVMIGDTIIVKAGEKIPLDGTIIEGATQLDTSALTGESVPRTANIGDAVLSGCVNLSGLIKIQTTKEFGQSTVSKILDLVENASTKKAKTEGFITRFAKIYTPLVVIMAVILVVVPPLVFAQPFAQWLNRGLIFLMVSCPCALVISVPLSFFGGIGGASKQGILIKGSNYLEALAKADIVVFDKTGTLTKGNFEVCEINAVNGDKAELLKFAAMAEYYVDHPISLSIKRAYGTDIDKSQLGESVQLSGLGVKSEVGGNIIYAGNTKLMSAQGITPITPAKTGTVVHVADQNEYKGYILIADTIKDDALSAIKSLKQSGVKKCVMLTGDAKSVAEQIGKQLEIDEIYAELLPADKVEHVERLISQKQNGTLCFVGDGINDAPVLARADVGVAMGAMGSDAAIESADVVLMQDNPSSLAKAIAISRKTLAIARQNIIFALVVKIIVLVLSAFGFANMWIAVFADVGVSALAIINATRALKYTQK